jgi:rSAM/selenodomain-associated transferase 1
MTMSASSDGAAGSALVVMAKAPIPGRTKTRVAADLGDAFAASLQEACIRDILVRPWPATERWLFTDGESSLWNEAQALGWRSEPQAPGDLSPRLVAAGQRVLAGGAHRVVVVGTDSPDLPEDLVTAAFACDLSAGPAFVPAYDGGYCLVAFDRLWPGLFEGIPWSTTSTLAHTLEALDGHGISALLLPAWGDIDTVADLRAVRLQSRVRQYGAVPHVASHVRTLLDGIQMRPVR